MDVVTKYVLSLREGLTLKKTPCWTLPRIKVVWSGLRRVIRTCYRVCLIVASRFDGRGGEWAPCVMHPISGQMGLRIGSGGRGRYRAGVRGIPRKHSGDARLVVLEMQRYIYTSASAYFPITHQARTYSPDSIRAIQHLKSTYSIRPSVATDRKPTS